MISGKITISGTGCALADYLYDEIVFDDLDFSKYLSKKPGDGGLCPGNLVFIEEIEKFAGKPYNEIIRDIIGIHTPPAFNVGGPSLVSLIHASQMLDNVSYSVRFYGITGKDKTADKIFEIIQRTPLDIANYSRIDNKDTPFTDVLSDSNYDNGNGERTFINNIGAAWDYSPAHLNCDFFDAHIVCFGGTALVPQIHDSLTALLKKAKNHNCITIVNTVFDFRNENIHPSKPWPIGSNTELSLSLTDILIMDSEEAIKISGRSILSDAAMYFSKHQVSSFLITNGTKEIIVYSNGTIFEKMDISSFPVSHKILTELQSDPHLKGDTTGCGDNFAGGVIANTAEQLKSKDRGKLDLIEALSWGVASGGFACYYLGGTFYEKKQGEKLEIIKSYQIDYLKQIDKYEFIDK